MHKEIGGYIELELNKGNLFHKNGIYINSARNGIKYAIKAFDIKEIHVPYYTCPVVWQSIQEENCKIIPYTINSSFMPQDNFNKNSFILYTNYFGVCSKNIKELEKKYKNLIIDNAMAFYMPHKGILSTYSPRKFFGLADGGVVITDKKLNKEFEKDTSYQRFSHLLKRVDKGADFGYEDFNRNDDSLISEPIKEMSNLTYKMLKNVNYSEIKKKRIRNYKFLHKNLSKYNLLKIKLEKNDVPMYYPFVSDKSPLIRQKLLESHCYIPKCWRGLLENIDKQICNVELYYYDFLLPLIIDQRYNEQDLKLITDVIRGELSANFRCS